MQELGVEEMVDQVPSGVGSRAKSAASVTGHMGREAEGNSSPPPRPPGRTWLVGCKGVRALGSMPGAEMRPMNHLWIPVLPTQVRLPERLPCPSKTQWHRPGGRVGTESFLYPVLLPLHVSLTDNHGKHHRTKTGTLTSPLDRNVTVSQDTDPPGAPH